MEVYPKYLYRHIPERGGKKGERTTCRTGGREKEKEIIL